MQYQKLTRELGLGGSIIIGLGSVLGTGVFVSIAITAGIAGNALLTAVVIAGMIAICNGFSSAGLAAVHPVSGGSYEYGYRFLFPAAGFTAGWMFLLAKSASAATAGLGFAGYAWSAVTGAPPPQAAAAVMAAGIILLFTLIVAAGVRRSTRLNAIIVLITVGSLLFFIALGTVSWLGSGAASGTVTALGNPPGSASIQLSLLPPGGSAALLHAVALMFVAFTGYGRIATLGEEVKNPRRTIPRAVLATLLLTMLLYIGVAISGYILPGSDGGSAGASAAGLIAADSTSASEAAALTAPLALRAAEFAGSPGRLILSIAAVTAMAGVLLNLILGLSRVLLAMGRRGDMPRFFSILDRSGKTPLRAVWAVGTLVLLLTLIGDVRTTWSFSAFSVLVYYAITNAAALRIPRETALYPRWISWLGLIGCLVPAFFVDPVVWAIGLGLLLSGLAWFAIRRRFI